MYAGKQKEGDQFKVGEQWKERKKQENEARREGLMVRGDPRNDKMRICFWCGGMVPVSSQRLHNQQDCHSNCFQTTS